MMIPATLPANTVLLPIDVQAGFDDPRWGARNNPSMEANGLALIAAWRERGLPVVHVRHDSPNPESPLRPGQPGNGFRPGFGPDGGEALVAKTVNSAFIGTDLELRLRRLGAGGLVIFGLVTDQCVSTTARMSANLGYRTFVVGDACACFPMTGPDGIEVSAEVIHRAHLATLHGEFCPVLDTRRLLAMLPAAAQSASAIR